MYMYASCTVIIDIPIYYLVYANLNEHMNRFLKWNDHVCVVLGVCPRRNEFACAFNYKLLCIFFCRWGRSAPQRRT